MEIGLVEFDVVPAEDARNYDILKTLRIDLIFHVLEGILKQIFLLVIQFQTDLENSLQTLEDGDDVRFLVDLKL